MFTATRQTRCLCPFATIALLSGALITAGGVPVLAQTPGMTCTATAGSPAPARPNEIAARISDIVVTCVGGTPTSAPYLVPTANFQVFLNTNLTSRTIGALSEALLLIDEPSPASQSACTGGSLSCVWTGGGAHTPNVFQSTVVGTNSVAFLNVPIDPPALGGTRTFRITNLRANAAQLGLPGSTPISIIAYLSMSGTSSISLSNPQLIVAASQNALNREVRSSSNDIALDAITGVELPRCTAAVQQRLSTLRFQEFFGSALLPRTSAPFVNAETVPSPLPQSVPGLAYGSETGFYNPQFPSSGGLNTAGLADSGTRLHATFTNVPAGVTLYASTVPVTFVNGSPIANSGSHLRARMIDSSVGVFAPTAPTDTLEGIPAAAVVLSGGSGSVVWEILQADASTVDSGDFLLWISYPANTVALGTANVSLRFAPVSTSFAASPSAPLPRFTDDAVSAPLLTIGASCPGSPYTVDTQPSGRQFSIDGTTYTAPKSFNWAPGSTHTMGVPTPQGVGGTRYVFTSWNDGGAATHLVSVPFLARTYTASFKTQFQLTRAVQPGGAGVLSAAPSAADGFYDAGTSVVLTASPSTGYGFVGFTGALTGAVNPASLKMSSPQNVTANFSVNTVLSGVTPPSGTGAEQQFDARYTHSRGYERIRWVQLLLATDPQGGGQPFCFLHYDVQGNGFWLYSDQAGFFQGPVQPGTASNALLSSICALDTAGSSVSGNGSILDVNFRVLFKATGNRNTYMRALDADEYDTGWSQVGTWAQAALALPTLSITPATGTGPAPSFTATFPDPPGFTGYPFGWVEFLMAADETGGGQPFCFVHYDRAGNGLWMYSSDDGFFVGPATPGVASGALSSSACAVNTALVTTQNMSGQLQLSIPLTLKAPMSGSKNVYLRMFDALARDTGWKQSGTWTIP